MTVHECSVSGCSSGSMFYIMGPRSGDWAAYYCGEHRVTGEAQLGPGALVEPVSLDPMPPVCEWFALCTRPSAGTVPHPILGAVPICTPCAEKMGYAADLAPWLRGQHA